MILSKRERTVVVLTAGALGVLLFDWMVLNPLLSRRKDLLDQIAMVNDKELRPAMKLIHSKHQLDAQWKQMVSSGLQADVSAAESQVLHALQVWAQEAGLGLSSLKPERNEKEKQFQKITIRATAAGSMMHIKDFLAKIQKSSSPLRISDIQISSRKEGTDDLSLQVGVSTLCLPPQAEAAAKAAPAAAREELP